MTLSEDKGLFYVDKYTLKQLNVAKDNVIKGDVDRFYIIDGREGTGKSTLAFQLAYSVDNTFNLDRVCFTSQELTTKIRELKKYQALVFDEAFNGLSSKGALSKENKLLVKLLMECRQKNLFVFIVLPTIFLLEKYVAIFRSHALFHVFVSRKNVNRRSYAIYNYKYKKMLYLLGKNNLDYTQPYMHRFYRFYGKLPPSINKEQYIKKKLEAFTIGGKKEKTKKIFIQRNIAWYMLTQIFNIPLQDIVDYYGELGISFGVSNISEAIKNIEDMKPKPPDLNINTLK